MLIQRALTICLVLLFFSAIGWAEEIVRYEDLPQLVQTKNRSVEAGRENVSAQKSVEGSFPRSFLPELKAEAGHETLREGSSPTLHEPFWSVEGRVNLFRGFHDYSEGKARRIATGQSEEDLKVTHRARLFEARRFYWHVLALQTLTRLQEEAIEQNEQNLKQAKRRAASGITTSADPLEFEMNRTLLEQNLQRLILDLDFSKNSLSVLIGIANHEAMKIEGKFIHPTDGEFQEVTIALDDMPAIKSLLARREHAVMEGKKHSTWWAPSLDAFSSYSRSAATGGTTFGSNEERDLLIGARLTMNFFDALESKHQSRSQEAVARSFAALEEERERELSAKFHDLKHNLKLHHELLHGADENAFQSERFLKLTLNEYGRGVKNGPDVLQAAMKKLEFSRRAVELARDYEITKAEILALLGE